MILAKYLEELNKWYVRIQADNNGEHIQILNQIEERTGLIFAPKIFNSAQGDTGNVCMANSPEVRDDYKQTFAPIDLLDYFYTVMHSASYRETYKQFLKIDFPRVPYPIEIESFWQFVALGGELRQLHLLKSPKVQDYITSYPIDGDNTITTKIGKNNWEVIGKGAVGRIWINEAQYFDNIPLVAWKFYIGGYQPTQKWLKDRKGRTLRFEDILHYQKIIVALTETDRLMQIIDAIIV